MAENSDTSMNPQALEKELLSLLTRVRETNSEQSWQEVECVAQTLANSLRVRDGPIDTHTLIGKTALPRSLTSLFTLSLHGSAIPEERHSSVVFEILRVAANLCMDHDENRGYLLEAGLPQALVSLLEGYAELVPCPPPAKPLEISISHLKVIRTAIGALLNACIGYDPVKDRLRSLEAPLTILRLSTAIYAPGSWQRRNDEGVPSQDVWSIRCSISDWAWRMISELKDTQDETLQIFTPDVLPLLVPPLLAPYAPELAPFPEHDQMLISTFINADLEALQESCMLIESLSLDVEDIRLSLARGLHFPAEHSGVPCLSIILDFIENGTYPPSWNLPVVDAADRDRKSKVFNICKAALIKSVVEVAGEERNEDVLWDDSEPQKPGGDFVDRMVIWLKRYVGDLDTTICDPEKQSLINRDNMVICASLSLGNLARREKNSIALLSPPHTLAPVLASIHLLSPSTDLKVKHGVLGLLKHLAQAPARAHVVHNALGEAGIIQRIAASGVWDDKIDPMADIVQLSAIGVVKHMCSANVDHTYAFVLASNQSPAVPTGLSQIIALVNRSDSIPLKSEGSRVVVNVVKSLWSNNVPAPPPANSLESPISPSASKDDIINRQRKRNIALRALLTPECAWILASLVGRSRKYPLLVNEGIVALSLLSTQKEGASLVLTAIMTPLSEEPSAEPSAPQVPIEPKPASTTSDSDSLVSATPDNPMLQVPRHALDMLVLVLRHTDNPTNFPVEVRVNVCSFILQLSKNTFGEELSKLKELMRPVLDSLTVGNAGEEILEKAVHRILDSWSM